MRLAQVVIVLSAASLSAWAAPLPEVSAHLQWHDCSEQADERGLEVVSYQHAPDPIVIGQPYVISRVFRSLLDRQIGNLTEKFTGYVRTPAGSWNQTFKNGPFSRCGTKEYQTACPLDPHSQIKFREHHPATHVVASGERKAVEYYYADDVFVGCVNVTYSYVDAPPVVV